ncbi:MAG: hypothetical protein ACI9GH_000023 [Candidatus Paceibacteria bacterium]|jgi:hypothetical protein
MKIEEIRNYLKNNNSYSDKGVMGESPYILQNKNLLIIGMKHTFSLDDDQIKVLDKHWTKFLRNDSEKK